MVSVLTFYCDSKCLYRQSHRLSLRTSQAAHQARAYPSFTSMKRLGVFLLTPE